MCLTVLGNLPVGLALYFQYFCANRRKLFLTTASTSAAISLRAAVKPGRRFSPNISFTLTIVNHKDAGLNMVTGMLDA